MTLAWAKVIETDVVRSGQILDVTEHRAALLLIDCIHDGLGEKRIQEIISRQMEV